MMRYAWNESDPRRARKLFSLLMIRVPLVAGLNAICFALDPIFFPGLRKTKIETPVFVIGHGRSGTTHLHDLLYQDERFSCFLMYELFWSALLPKVLIRWSARFDAERLGGFFARRARARSDARYSKTRDAHHQAADYPEEDDGILTYSCSSGSWSLRVPDLSVVGFHYVDEMPDRKRRRMMRFYRECIRRQLYLNGPGKIHLSKNPTFTGRVESLIEFFPDAKFIIPYRNPLETMPSLLKLMRGFWEIRGVSEERMENGYRLIKEQSLHSYLYPAKVLAKHPEVLATEIDYRELIEQPKAVVERVYRDIGFPIDAGFERVLDDAQARAGKHETKHRYSLVEFDLDEAAIREELAPLFERFDWPSVDARPR
ncbi:MAG: sulfotransferase family protein [Deltaproteobacteria bacterium]|nr:sulfotransferase family protein [Deltaproteobacteria bacterium]